MKLQTIVALALPVLFTGCSADYLNRYDSVTLAQGDAVKSNVALHAVDPFNPDSQNTHIEGDGKRLARVMNAYQGGQMTTSQSAPRNRADIDCKDVDGPVAINGADPNRLDADKDGIGCERN